MKSTYQTTTFVDLLRRRVVELPDRMAYTFLADGAGDEARITYSELDRRARSIAALLQSHGGSGERVLLLYPPGLDYISAFFGCLYAGAIAVPVYPPRQNRTLGRILNIINDAQPAVALTTSRILSRNWRLTSGADGLNSMRWLAVEGETTGAEDEWRKPLLTGKSLAFLQYTSGSTGEPKGVMLSHGNLIHNSELLRRFFEYTPESFCVSWLPIYHDMGLIGGMLQPLYGGYPCAFMSPVSFLQRPLRWLEAISRYQATISGGPNFAYELCVRKISLEQSATLDLRSWTTAFNGSEPIRAETLKRFADAFSPCGFREQAFFPCYGLAESTLIVSGGENSAQPVIRDFQVQELEKNRAVEAVSKDSEPRRLVGSGRRLPGDRVIIVNPEILKECSHGEIGEVWVAGGSVASGYWNLPSETARAFQAFTLDTLEGPFLRTGDLGLLLNGELFITGRLKDLIIIRGLNRYPQDIELTVERSHLSLRPGCGAAFSVEFEGEERLVVTQEIDRAGENAGAVIELIRRRVAEEHDLQPFAVVLIRTGSLPKTSSGKIQRQACRSAFLNGTLESIASWQASRVSVSDRMDDSTHPFETREAVLKWLTRRIAARAGIDPSNIEIDRPIDHYGMDSLMATELAHSIEINLGVSVPMVHLLGDLSISQLVDKSLENGREKLNEGLRTRTDEGIQSQSDDNLHPPSYGQKALWFLQQLAPESANYNIAGAARVNADLDIEALRRSFEVLLERHAGLRTTFISRDGEPFQKTHNQIELSFQHEDASFRSDMQPDEQLTAHAQRPFDLECGPLLRIVVFTISPMEHVVLLTAHHIISDFWSLAILLNELREIYPAVRRGLRPQLQALALNYVDFVRRQSKMLAGPEGEKCWLYWKNQLAGELPVIDLPTDRPRPPAQTYQGASHPFRLEAQLTQELKHLGSSRGATLFMTLLAGFQALLHRYTGQEDLLVGSLTSGRDSAESAGLVGYFVNPVVIRADFSGLPNFNAFLECTRRTVLGALEHQRYPFPLLVERLQPGRDPSRSPIFQSMFIFQKSHLFDRDGLASFAVGADGARVTLGELPLESVRVEQGVAQFDLTLAIAETDDRLSASLQYNVDLFDHATIVRFADHLQTLLKGIVAAPDRPISTLPMLTSAERYSLLIERNSTRADFAAGLCIQHLFENQARGGSDRIAVVYENEQLCFRELNRRANQLARHLQGLGVGPQVLVGVYLDRSIDLLIGLLGILKAGGAYLPLDPAHPKDRLEFVIQDAGAPVIVTSQRLLDRSPLSAANIVCLGTGAFLSNSDEEPASAVCADNAAYVIYTSGTTGKPKGVMLSHRNVLNFFRGMDDRIGCDASDTMLAQTSVSFDISALELFWSMARGAKVILLAEQGLGAASNDRTRPRIVRNLDFSLFYFASSDSQQNKDERYRLLFEGAKFADSNSFEAVWTPERHFHAFGGLFPNPSVMSAALAAVTKRVKIRAGSVVLPLHHPIRIAEEWSLVDNISGGRAGIAFASGWHSDDFVFSPDSYPDRKEITFKGVELVRGLWRGGSIKVPGGAGNEIEVKIFPTPAQAELPVWITAAGNSETFVKAGELGVNVLTHLLGQTIEGVSERISLYRRTLAQHGHDPRSGRVTLMLHAYLDDDVETAREKVRLPFTNYLRSSIGLISNLIKSLNLPLDLNDMSETDMNGLLDFAFDRYFETSALFGTAESCAPMIDRLKAGGVDEVACLVDFGVDTDSALSGLERLNRLREISNSDESEGDYSLPAQAARHSPTLMQCTPSQMKMLAADADSLGALGSLRKLMLGGEALSSSLVSQVREALPATIVNMYGPTETAIWSSTHSVAPSDSVISIGSPIANTQMYILDRRLQPLPCGLTGQLHIAGMGLAFGYHNHPDLTAEKFIPNHFGRNAGARIYRTGDLARYLEGAGIEVLGRIDQQVKLRGFRIEIEEIETTLNQHHGVAEAVVVVREHAPGDKRLVAYLVPAPGAAQNDKELDAFLRQKLPDYMIPSSFVMLDRLPLTSNGKVDRKSLPVAEIVRKQLQSEYKQPQGELEQLIAEIWRGALKVDKVGRADNFFDLGGHSLLLAQVHGQLSQSLNTRLSLIKMLEYPTVGSLAGFLNQEQGESLSVEKNRDRAAKLREGLSRQRRNTRKARHKA